MRIRFLTTGSLIVVTLATSVTLASPQADALSRPWLDPSRSAATRANLLLAAMTLPEKVNELHGVDTSLSPVPTDGFIPAIPRLGVPAVTMTDGPAGVRQGQRATELPAPIAQAASFDPNVAKAYGSVVGADARALGQTQVFGPGMNIARVPTNGRNFEYYSEDPLLSGTIAGADVVGIQSHGVIATIKHFVANNQETDRTSVNASIDDRTLHEIYEKNFGIAVSTGHPGSVMCSYNQVNAIYACSNAATLSTALRTAFGFDGYVVSDYPATHDTSDLTAGLNVELPVGVHLTLPEVQAALRDGRITQSVIDQRVRETLTVLFRFGMFERNAQATSAIDEASDNAAAQSIAEQSAVLLKNTGVLPLTSASASVAVIGSTAKVSAQGYGSSQVDPLSIDNVADALTARAAAVGASVTYNDGYDNAAAASAAAAAQTAVVVVRDYSTENADRANLSLPNNQVGLIDAVAAANPHTIVVLETGAPVLMPWLDSVAGVVEAWYPGARGGAAVARLLYGDVDFSGKLPQTWPRLETEVPANTAQQYPGVAGQETYSEGVDVGYRWYDQNHVTPLFPFGYGLSYTQFRYSGLTLAHQTGTSDDGVTVTFTVKNVGHRAGVETPQVYVGKPDTLVTSPPRELGAFTKVSLAPGQSKTVTLSVARRELAYWDVGAQAFTVQDGVYGVGVGGSSRSLPLTTTYRVTKTDGPVQLTVAGPTSPVVAGTKFRVTGTVTNRSDVAVSGARLRPAVPSGWSVTPTSSSIGAVGSGRSATAAFVVTVPSTASGSSSAVNVTATATAGTRAVAVTRSTPVDVPVASVDAARDTVGVTADAAPSAGDFDAAGYSYSAEGLAAAGVTPGGSVTVDGTTVQFPAQAPGTPDAVTARGQTIPVSGTGRLVLLGAATIAPVTDAVTVHYTDGSSTPVPTSFADWYDAAASPPGVLVATAPWNQPPGGIGAHVVGLYGQTIELTAGKTVSSVTLPTDPNLHLFTIAVG